MQNVYTPYHMHTEDSILDSCTKFTEYIDLAEQNGQKAISFSEHGRPVNWTQKWSACKSKGIKYMHSCEIYLTESLDEKKRDNYHTVLIARNMDGVRELNKLISKSCEESHFYYVNRVTFDEFLAISDNIISTSACLASPLNKLPTDHPYYLRLASKYDFFEIQAHAHPDQIAFNRRLLTLSKSLNKPLIAGTDTHSSSEYKAECRLILLSAKGMSYGDEDRFDLTYKTYDGLYHMFDIQGALPESVFREAIANTNELIGLTEELSLDTAIKYPILYGTHEADSEKFTETVEKKFKEKLDSGIIPEDQAEAFRSAIDEEMKVFRTLKMDGFMLGMSEMLTWCKQNGLAIGTARGSVGGSRVAYVTDIIDLNPETWHTVFSRFCNVDREEIGDIDIDFIDTDRPKIFEYITNRFGKAYTARVASFGTLADKAAIDEIGRYFRKKFEKENGKDIPNPYSVSNVAQIKSLYDANPDGAREKNPEIFRYFDGLVGTKISQSVHPAGMVISPITMDDNYGVFEKDGESCLMLDMDNIHDFTGLAKYDYLILKTVKLIKLTCDYLGVPYPRTHEINWNDEAVWTDMRKCPYSLFQFEGSFAFDSLKKFRPENIFELSLVTAAIRPSGASYRDDLLARKPHHNPSELIDDLLKNNHGYLVYQEDIIAFLQQICGLTGSEADTVRRGIARKKTEIFDAMLPKILDGYCSRSSKPREVAEEEAREFLQIIEDASSYMFG